MLTNKQLGLGIMLMAVMFMIVGLVYISQSESFVKAQIKTGPKGECVHDGTICPYQELNKLAVPKYIGGVLFLVMFGCGLYLYMKKKPEEAAISKAKKTAKDLGEEEAKVYEIILNANGMVFQNEIVDKLQYSKVKVTRLLDRLEIKGLIERKRRGMTNIVILK